MSRVLLGVALVLGAAACGGGGTSTVTVTRTVTTTRIVTATTQQTAACPASALTGTFAVITGSAGAGQIGYRLRLTNQGDATCFVSGLPDVQLLGRDGGGLPTNVSPREPGSGAAVRVDLSPGDAATADARFSPDIPGGSEPTDQPCEPKAFTLRVTIGAGTLDVPVVPPTPVCERGSLEFSNLAAAS